MSQEDLAEKLNVSRQAISRWESGNAMPDASNTLQISKLFGVTTDFLLNDEFESDQDIPLVQTTKSEANRKITKILFSCLAAFGLVGNLVIYIISRFVEVMIPRITYENGEKWYHWSSEIKGRSYQYFIQEYNLEFLVMLFWLLVIGGLVAAFVPKEKFVLLKDKVKVLLKR